jgi:hypothetical protein
MFVQAPVLPSNLVRYQLLLDIPAESVPTLKVGDFGSTGRDLPGKL